MPSHIIAPAVHLTKDQVEADFRRVHTHLPADRSLVEPTTMLTEARNVLRERFLAADVGITGANFLVAETGTSIIVTNEGNGDLTQTLPKVHIVLATHREAGADAGGRERSSCACWRARRPGQEMSVYTTFSTGPRRPGDPDGPAEYHVVLLDNGRSAMLGGAFQDMLRCIRCGACMNHCPVYHAVGGHAYGWVYPGPMGAVLTPSLVGVDQAGHLPNASTFCGRCEEVCPVRIPLPRMMRAWREREFERHLSPATVRSGLAFWACVRQAAAALSTGRPRSPPSRSPSSASSAGASTGCRSPRGWTRHRDFPAPEGRTFQAQWRRRAATMSSRDTVLALDPPLARRERRRDAAPRRRGGAPRAPSCRRHSGARTARAARARCELFRTMMELAAGTVEEIARADDVPAAVSAFLRAHNLPMSVRRGGDPRLAAMPWARERTLTVATGPSDGSDLVAVSHAFGRDRPLRRAPRRGRAGRGQAPPR